MRPEEVPAGLVELGMRAMGMWSKRRDLDEQTVRDVLAAVLPEVQAQAWARGQAAGMAEANQARVLGDARPRLNPYQSAARLTATTEEPTT